MDESRDQIEALTARMAAGETEAERSRLQADDDRRQADDDRRQADDDRSRLGVLEGRVDIDEELIAELQREGILNREHVQNLEVALRSSRVIGAALGIVMRARDVTDDVAFQMLRQASIARNRKLRLLAEDLVATGDVESLTV